MRQTFGFPAANPPTRGGRRREWSRTRSLVESRRAREPFRGVSDTDPLSAAPRGARVGQTMRWCGPTWALGESWLPKTDAVRTQRAREKASSGNKVMALRSTSKGGGPAGSHDRMFRRPQAPARRDSPPRSVAASSATDASANCHVVVRVHHGAGRFSCRAAARQRIQIPNRRGSSGDETRRIPA